MKYEDSPEHAITELVNVGTIDKGGHYKPVELLDTEDYCGPEELAMKILEETPDAIELFGNREDMIGYIREAMAATCDFCKILAPQDGIWL